MDHHQRTNPHRTYQPIAMAYSPFAPMPDVRWLQAELTRLRQLLQTSQAHASRQANAIRHQAEHEFSHQKTSLLHEIRTLGNRLASLEQQSRQETEKHEQECTRLKADADQARRLLQTSDEQIVALKQELQNLAAAASAEQRELQQRHLSMVARHEAMVAEQGQTIDVLRSQLADQDVILEHWRVAQDQAVSLSEWYETEHHKMLVRLSEQRDEHDRYRARTSEAFALCEEEIETLEATVEILGTDHETVELINADLDHLNDQLQSELQQLQCELESVLDEAARERQDSAEQIEAMTLQLQESSTRLISVSEEKKSLLETVSKLNAKADDFDASLFAKDQEINATKRVAAESQRQLDLLRREHSGVSNQNDEMRNRVREAVANATRLETELADACRRAEQAEASITERDHQIRELQSVARAAEASAMLRANEAEQQYVVELQRLESLIQQHEESARQLTHSDSDYQSRIAELENALAASKQSAAASASENDRLQQTNEQLTRRLDERESAYDVKRARIEMLEATLAEMKSDASKHAEETSQLRLELANRRNQLAEYADRIATQQNRLLRQEQDIAEAQRQLQQSDAPEQDPLVDALQQQVVELTAQRDRLTQQDAESSEAIRRLQIQLDDWMRYENPVNEVKRLSAELAQKTAEQARERERYLRRIEQLQTPGGFTRAA